MHRNILLTLKGEATRKRVAETFQSFRSALALPYFGNKEIRKNFRSPENPSRPCTLVQGASRIFVTFALMLLVFAGTASAATFGISIIGIAIAPSQPTVGDTIYTDVQFKITGPSDPKVKLIFYVDGVQKDSFLEFLDPGTYTRRFSFSTVGMFSGSKEIRVEANVYDGDAVVGTSSTTATIFLRDVGSVAAVHDITITQISYKTAVLTGEKFPVTVSVKNTGFVDEQDVFITMRLGDQLLKSEFFNVRRGDTQARTIYMTAPLASGRYTLTITAKSASSTAKSSVENGIDVTSATLTMSVSPASATVGDWITVSGYALMGGGLPAPAGSVSIYKDGAFALSANPDRSGYYSANVRFSTPGPHTIGARLQGLERNSVIYLSPAPAPTPTPTPTPLPTPVYPPAGTAIVIINGTIYIYGNVTNATVPSPAPTPTPNATNVTQVQKIPYLSITPNAKEVYVDQFKANTIYIEIANNLGRDSIFSVKSSFDPRLVFLPEPQIVKNGERKTFAVVFNAAEGFSGLISGTLMVYDGNKTVETIPVNVFVVQKKEATTPKQNVPAGVTWPPFAFDYALAGIIAIIAIVSLLMHFRRTRPLEPKILPFNAAAAAAARVREKAPGVAAAPLQRKADMRSIFRVPWRNVVC